MSESPPGVSPSSSTYTIDHITQDAASVLNPQHLRLIIDPLPSIKDANEFSAWIRRAPVSGAWAEFTAAVPHPSPNPDSSTIVGEANAVLEASPYIPSSKFLKLNPDKSDWSAADHHVRFVVAIISDCSVDARHRMEEWVRRYPASVRGIYEVLVFLKATSGLEEKPSEVDPAKV